MNNRFKKIYSFVSIQFFSVVIIFVILNVVVSFFIKSKKDKQPEVAAFLNEFVSKESYTDSSLTLRTDSDYVKDVINDFLDYTYFSQKEYRYYPGVEFIQAPFSSKHIHVQQDENDLSHRQTLLDTDSSKYVIYCFGGSTTFGSFVSDEHTWPSLLMKEINNNSDRSVSVRNYGVSGYTVTQETDLFIHLVKGGHRPSLVIFMDGINTGPVYDGSEFSKGISRRFSYLGEDYSLRKIIAQLPIIQLIQSAINPFEGYSDTGEDIFPAEESAQYNGVLVSRFIENSKIRKSIAELYGINIIQILQPNVFVNYDYSFLNDLQRKGISETTISNYRYIYQEINKNTDNYKDLSYLFDLYKYPALVDGMHYSPDFNRFMTTEIIHLFNIDELHEYIFEDNSKTGVPFVF